MFCTRPTVENSPRIFPIEHNFGYDNLVVSGCSFTHNNSDKDICTWPYYLRELGNFKNVYDCSLPGAGNHHVSQSLQWELVNNQFDPRKTLVVVMWSGNDRDDVICDENVLNQYPMKYQYAPGVVTGITGGSHDEAKGNIKAGIDLKKLKSPRSRAIENFLYINGTKIWLEHHDYRSIFLDYINRSLPNRSLDFDIYDYLPLNCQKKLHDIIDHCTDLYTFCLKNDLLSDDDFHPSPEGHLQWTKKILIPYLKS